MPELSDAVTDYFIPKLQLKRQLNIVKVITEVRTNIDIPNDTL